MTRSMRPVIVQHIEMPIDGGTAASCCKGKVLRSLEWITQQPLQQPHIYYYRVDPAVHVGLAAWRVCECACLCRADCFNDHDVLQNLLLPVVHTPAAG